MQAEEHLRQGNVVEALAELKSVVQKNPADAKYRAFLFQLFAVLGKWDSAVNQLQVCGELDAGMLAMVQAYREAIRCESMRHRVFAGQAAPLIFGQPDRWLALMVQALKHTTEGHHGQAARLREEAFEEAPATSGTIELDESKSVSFDWIADADPRFGPVLEAYLNGQYYWIPLHRIRQIDFEAPADLRDFVWTPAHFEWANGGDAFGMIPTRYPGSETSADSLIQLARKTEWPMAPSADPADEIYLGLGQRMLATDAGEFALLDLRKIALDVTDEAAAGGNAQAAAPDGSDSPAPGEG